MVEVAGTDTGNTAQKVVGLEPYRAGPDRVVDIVVDLAQIAFQRTDMFIDLSTNRFQSHRPTVFLGDDHLHDLLSTDGKGAQLGGFGIRNRADRGPDAGGEFGQDVGIDPIGLGQLAHRTGEITNLTRIHNHDRQSDRGQSQRHVMLISPGGFQNDQFRGKTCQLGHQFFVAPGVVADCGDGRVRSDNATSSVDLETSIPTKFCVFIPVDPSLRMRA